MIYSQVTGGLGNQFYNYAIGYALAKKNDDHMLIDISAYKFAARPFVLHRFNLSYGIADLYSPTFNNRFSRMIARIQRKLYTAKGGGCKWMKEEAHSRNKFYDYDFSYRHNLYLEGYWQNYRYFDEYREGLLEEFAVREETLSLKCIELITKVSSENSVALHIRRGDYESKWCIGEDYYYEAIRQMNSRVPAAKYYIFCEDKEVAAEYLARIPDSELITGAYELDDIEEFCVMSACRNQIIANSTYSWWAAYLNRNVDKNVVAPITLHWKEEYYPENWITVDI